jgi:hypothetical protein
MRENEERWMQLCAQATQGQDPKKLAELIMEINRLLEAKRNRLTKAPSERQDRS